MEVKAVTVIVLILSVFFLLLAGAACEPLFTIKVENQTTQQLKIYMNGNFIGTIEQGKILEKETMLVTSKIRFEARNLKGELIFTKEYTPSELRGTQYRIVIK